MRRKISLRLNWGLLVLGLALLGLAGCSTTDEPDNLSARPWNQPKGWENGSLPSMLNEGR